MLKAGVATHFCDSGKLFELETALIDNPKNVTQVLNELCPPVEHEFVLQKHMKQINECFNAPTIEGVLQNLQKDNSEWAQATIKVNKTFRIYPTYSDISITFFICHRLFAPSHLPV